MSKEIPKEIEYSFEWAGMHGGGVNKSIYVSIYINIENETHKITYDVYDHKELVISTQDCNYAIMIYNEFLEGQSCESK